MIRVGKFNPGGHLIIINTPHWSHMSTSEDIFFPNNGICNEIFMVLAEMV